MNPEQAFSADEGKNNEQPKAFSEPTEEQIGEQTEESDSDSDSEDTQFLKSLLGNDFTVRQRVGGSHGVIDSTKGGPSGANNWIDPQAMKMEVMSNRVEFLSEQVKTLVS